MLDGFLVIDKPAGITSHDVVSRVRRIFGTRKVGHTGTLDPFATGVLPVAVNEGTKAIPYLDEGRKGYEATLRLGLTTDTLDITGNVLSEVDPSCVTLERLKAAFSEFSGTIAQMPPMYSAIKQNGQPLYKLARQGVEVERKVRTALIHSLELLLFEPPHAVFRVVCSRGTYIRSLADDIGKILGCGAVLTKLRRTMSGPFDISDAHTLEEVEKAKDDGCHHSLCVSHYSALGHLRELKLDAAALKEVSFGRSPHSPGILQFISGGISGIDEHIRLSYMDKLAAVAVVKSSSDSKPTIVLKRVFNIDP